MLASYEGQCGLSKREAEVCDLLCEGKTYQAVAGQLGIANTTARTIARNAFTKVGCDNSLNLTLYAWQMAHAV